MTHSSQRDSAGLAAERARAQNAIDRENFAVRRELRALVADEQRLEERLDDLRADERRARRAVDAAWRAQHWPGG